VRGGGFSQARVRLLKLPCGGGRRSWGFSLLPPGVGSEGGGGCEFAWVRDSKVSVATWEGMWGGDAGEDGGRVWFHGRELHAVLWVGDDLLTGCEDGTVKVIQHLERQVSATSKGGGAWFECRAVTTMEGDRHRQLGAPVRCITVSGKFDQALIFGGGGKDTLHVWRHRGREGGEGGRREGEGEGEGGDMLYCGHVCGVESSHMPRYMSLLSHQRSPGESPRP
jgi:hypothetical protein